MNKLNIVFKGRPSALSDILSGNMGLTETQTARLQELQNRKDSYDLSREKAERLAKEKDGIPELKEKLKTLKSNKKNLSAEEFEVSFTALDSTFRNSEKIISDLTSDLKGIAPLTEKMEAELQDLLNKKLNPDLPQGAKTYVKKYLKEALFGRRDQIKNKYLSKGNRTEEDGFTLLCLNEKLGFILKNEVRKENEFLSGECDIDHEERDTIFDNKSSWSLSTFPMFETTIPDQKYYDQGQGYMFLYGRSKAGINYSLVDCPKDLLVREFPYTKQEWNSIDNQIERYKIANNLIFTEKYFEEIKKEFFPDVETKFVEIPRKLRTKLFMFDRNEALIQTIKIRVVACQKYLDTLVENLDYEVK